MKKQIYIMLIAVIIVVFLFDRIGFFILDSIQSKNMYGQSGGTINYYVKSAKKEKFDLLILGNSRAHHNLNPDSLVEKGFNLSHNGMSLVFQAGLLHYLEAQKALPKKYVLLHVEPSEFREAKDENSIYLDAQHLKGFYSRDSLIREYINRISSTERYKYLFKLYQYNGKIPSLIKNLMHSIKAERNDNGYYGIKHETYQIDILRKKQQYIINENEKFVAHKQINKPMISVLDELLKVTKRNNIELVLFTSPYFELPKAVLNNSIQIENWSSKNNVEYYNFLRSKNEELHNEKMWRDNAHLSAFGSVVFSKILKDSTQELRIR
jgi:hypothetical protein